MSVGTSIRRNYLHTVNFKKFRLTKTISHASANGSGASIFGCDVDGMQCVMKEYLFDRNDRDKFTKILREVRLIEKISHPNVVRHLSNISKATSIQLFMTRYESSLSKVIQQRRSHVANGSDDMFTSSQITNWMTQIASGLAYLHQNDIIHRDLKPSNLFVNFTERGEVDVVVIGDFDTAKIISTSNPKTLCGTKNYMAPEISRLDNAGVRLQVYTTKADVWSFGMVLYELMTLTMPYSDQPGIYLISERPVLPPVIGRPGQEEMYQHLIQMFYQCSEKDPDKRPTALQLFRKV
jgi:mitogen-activated protein kinase kinase kinase 1